MILIMKYFLWADLLFQEMLLVRRKSLVFFCIVTHFLLWWLNILLSWTMCRNFSYYNGPTFNEPFNEFIASSLFTVSSHSCRLKCCFTIRFHFLLEAPKGLKRNCLWILQQSVVLQYDWSNFNCYHIPASDSPGLIRSVVPIAWLCSVDMQSPDLISTYT